MRSERLPGKVLLPLPIQNGKPVVQWIIDQLELSRFNPEIVIATSGSPADNKLASYCKTEHINCFRGDEEDVLSRFITVSKEYGFNTIVRLTGDNPLLDIEILDNTIERHIKDQNDYTSSAGLPLGMNIEVISDEALLGLEDKKLSVSDREHVTNYIRQTDTYKKGVYHFKDKKSLKNLRLTIDYPADYAVLSLILSFYDKSTLNGIALIEFILDNYPWIFSVNEANIQKKQFKKETDEIEAAKQLLKKSEMLRAAELLEKHEK